MGFRDFFRRLTRSVSDYNIFDTNSTDTTIIRIQRWSTRLYILMLTLAMMVLIFYTVFHFSASQYQIEDPSLSTYFYFYNKHPNIQCPCTQISTLYSKFLQLSPSFNQICSSYLMSDQWIAFLFDNNQTTSRYAADFRATASNQFQILRNFCELSMTAIENNLENLYDSYLISGQLLSKSLFETQIEADILAFQTITKANFDKELTLVRAFMFGNQLMPAIETAFTIIVRSDTPGVIRDEPGVNIDIFRQSTESACACTDYANCNMSAGFYDIVTFDTSGGVFDEVAIPPRESVPGWYTGCWPSETLLLSTTENFYNQTALNHIVSYFNSSANENLFLALNSSISSRFAQNITIGDLVQELFVENWTKALNYTAYFNECQPKICTYDSNQRESVIYIFTSLLGLYGGLSIVLVYVTPHVVASAMKRFRQRRAQVNVINHEPEIIDEPLTFRERVRQLRFFLLNLNLFKSHQKMTPADLEHQRWSTRFYILSLILALLFLILYNWIMVNTKIVQIKNPSWSIVENLQKKVSSLECPCTELSVLYEDLISLEPDYHQICSSDFVSAKWIDGLNDIASASMESLYYADFRYSSSIFQLLKSMCDLANDTVINALYVFGQTQLVTSDLLKPTVFTEQLKSAIMQFQLTTPNDLLHLLLLTRNVTYMNQFLSGSYANFYVDYAEVAEYIHTNMTLGIYGSTTTLSNGTSVSCSCANDIECGQNAALYTGPSGHREVIYTVPGFYSRCFPVESLLPSTLECFYSDQPCLDLMSNVTNETFFSTMTKLNASLPSRFSINTTINELLSELFIESWISELFYAAYFNKCQPASCSYVVNTQKSTLEIVTTVTGLIGGLSIAFRVFTPHIILIFITLIRKRRRFSAEVTPQIQDNNQAMRRVSVRDKILTNIMTLNAFEKTYRAPANEYELHVQRQSTRLYFLLLLIVLFTLIIYTSLMYQQSSRQIKIPSLAQYQNLQDPNDSIKIDCPCTQISFPYATFYQIEPVFHQICSSDFVETNWLNILFEKYNNQEASDSNSMTFIGTAFAYFQSLRIMCDLTKQTVIDAQNLFLETQMVSASMIDKNLFNEQTTANLNSFQSTISNNFMHILNILLGMAQGNGLVSAYSTNWGVFLLNMTKDATIYTKARIYGDCNCAISSSCTQSSVPYVPGFVVACLPLESFLRSTFECLYNQTCVNLMSSYINATIILIALNRTNTRFEPTLATNNIVEEMFIESWSYNISYDNFFQQCQPKTCSYTVVQRSNILFVFTTIVGLYGGLTVLLKIVAPFVVRRIHSFIRKSRHTINPIESAANGRF